MANAEIRQAASGDGGVVVDGSEIGIASRAPVQARRLGQGLPQGSSRRRLRPVTLHRLRRVAEAAAAEKAVAALFLKP